MRPSPFIRHIVSKGGQLEARLPPLGVVRQDEGSRVDGDQRYVVMARGDSFDPTPRSKARKSFQGFQGRHVLVDGLATRSTYANLKPARISPADKGGKGHGVRYRLGLAFKLAYQPETGIDQCLGKQAATRPVLRAPRCRVDAVFARHKRGWPMPRRTAHFAFGMR